MPGLAAKLARLTGRMYARELATFKLNAVEAQLMALLFLDGPLPVGELQAALGLGGSTLTGILDRLQKRELVKRVPDPADRRSFKVEPAPWPAKTRDALVEKLDRLEDRCLRGLLLTERHHLGELLQRACAVAARAGDEE